MVGTSIANNLQEVREKIAEAAQRCGRSANEIQLLAVSKKQPVEKILQAVKCGQLAFGENYVQELLTKQSEVAENVQWHLIGALQRKKVKQVVGKVELIHSVDRIELIEALQKTGVRQKILLQVNVGREENKSGILEEHFEKVAEFAVQQSNLQVEGVMSLPPLSEEESDIRQGFIKTRQFLESLKRLNPQASVLSMGTTHDYSIAVEEGATIVRVGTAIFGERSA